MSRIVTTVVYEDHELVEWTPESVAVGDIRYTVHEERVVVIDVGRIGGTGAFVAEFVYLSGKWENAVGVQFAGDLAPHPRAVLEAMPARQRVLGYPPVEKTARRF